MTRRGIGKRIKGGGGGVKGGFRYLNFLSKKVGGAGASCLSCLRHHQDLSTCDWSCETWSWHGCFVDGVFIRSFLWLALTWLAWFCSGWLPATPNAEPRRSPLKWPSSIPDTYYAMKRNRPDNSSKAVDSMHLYFCIITEIECHNARIFNILIARIKFWGKWHLEPLNPKSTGGFLHIKLKRLT